MRSEATDKTGKIEISVDDKLVRFIGIPFFGTVIPSATGLVDLTAGININLISGYLYFILMAGVIWEGNRFLLFRYYHVIFDTGSDIKKYVLILALDIFYTLPVAFLLLYIWKTVFSGANIPPNIIWLTTAIIVVCVVFVTNMYEKALLVKHTEDEKVKLAKLEKDKLQAELEALKNQIDPHFMFNALNSVSYLIEKDTHEALAYVENLAEVYRYILRSKEKDLVLLSDEISFMNAYTDLIKLRFGEAFQLDVSVDRKTEYQFLIPPISIMMAIENAVKHNELSEKKRITLSVTQENGCLKISNNLNRKTQKVSSTKLGLVNLNARFEKLIGEGVSFENNGTQFKLRLPLLKLNAG